MGRVIAVTILGILAQFAILIVVYKWGKFNGRQRGDLTKREETKLAIMADDANRILHNIITPSNVDEFDVLTPTTRQTINEHLNKYRREIERA